MLLSCPQASLSCCEALLPLIGVEERWFAHVHAYQQKRLGLCEAGLRTEMKSTGTNGKWEGKIVCVGNGGNVTLLQGSCQILSACCATWGICAVQGFALTYLEELEGINLPVTMRRWTCFPRVPVSSRWPSIKRWKMCYRFTEGWWQGKGRYKGNSRRALWICSGTPRLALYWDLPVACTSLKGFIIFLKINFIFLCRSPFKLLFPV